MEKFLAKVAKQALNKYGNNLSDLTVLLPSHRACIYFKQALIESGQGAIWFPEISTLQDWVFNQSDIVLTEQLEQVLTLFELYKTKGGTDSLDEFMSIAQVMLLDFSEVDLQMADAKYFFNYLEQLQSLKVYEPGEEPNDYAIQYRKFWEMFRELYFALREQSLKQGKGYEGMIYRDVAERIESIAQKDWKLICAGFSGLTRSEEIIIKHLKDTCGAEIIWDTDLYYLKDEYHEAGSFFRKYKNEWHIDNTNGQNNLIVTEARQINIIGVAKNMGQTKVLADILNNKLKLDAASEMETVVVVPDEKLLNPILKSIPSNISNVNVSMGFPLRESQIAELIRLIFALQDGVERFQQKHNKQRRYYFNHVFDLLQHPYANYLIGEASAISDFADRIRRNNRIVVADKDFQQAFKGPEFAKLFWYTDNVKGFLELLSSLIDTLRIHFLKIVRDKKEDLTIDLELLFQLNNILQNLGNVLARYGTEISVQTLRKLIMETIRSTRVPFEGEPVRGLQIMGTMETRCLDFKNVIILSMNEGIFPAGKTSNSYVPYEMRREFLSTYRDKDAVSAYLFYRLLQRAEHVYLVYNTESDELGGGEKSRFMLQIQHELKRANPKALIQDWIYSVAPPQRLPDADIVVNKDEHLLKKLKDNIAGYGISPSAINTYINCSLQYYLRYVANLREQDDVEESIEAATLGSAVHTVLENLYTDLIGKKVPVDFIEGLAANKEMVATLLQKAFEGRFDEESLKSGKNYLLYRVCLKLIDEFLKFEIANLKTLEAAGNEMKILLLEAEMKENILVGDETIIIRGKVDRVEECDGVISVADYKTGNPAGSSIKGEDVALFSTDPKYAKAMQLLTYAWLFWRKEGSGNIRLRSGIYWLREINKSFDALKLDGGDLINSGMLLQFEEVLKKVLSELIDPLIPFSKTSEIERCVNCEFVKICRRD
jgi:ATP-dependent helicase/nuclease subunit B